MSSASHRREETVGICHDVADDVNRPGHALVLQRLRRALVRTEEKLGYAVDLDARVLLRHREVAAAETGLDVCERQTSTRRSPRTGQRRVRVAVHEDEIRSLVREDLLDAGCHRRGLGRVEIEPIPRLRKPELVEEDLRELHVVVLPGVDDDFVETGRFQRDR